MRANPPALLCTLLLLLCGGVPADVPTVDPPERVARLDDQRGAIAYSPAGGKDWIDPMPNRALTSGDRFWSARDAMLEMQIGSAALRLAPQTSFEILALDDRVAQLRLGEGRIDLRVHRIDSGQRFEVATPKLVFVIERAGHYRIAVDAQRFDTTITVLDGAGSARRGDVTRELVRGDAQRFRTPDLFGKSVTAEAVDDAFTRYCAEREARHAQAFALRHVADDVVGYLDLDVHGRWKTLPEFGAVWFPNQVAPTWAPFREGRWLWQQPWGWTWVDDQPWGFVTAHYGRWTRASGQWGWVPGPRHLRAVYAPASVAFVGGDSWSVARAFSNAAPVGWFPLAPGDVQVPPYPSSRDYFARINLHNGSVRHKAIANAIERFNGVDRVAGLAYANQQLSGALTAVPGDVFLNTRPVGRGAMHIDRRAALTGEILRSALVVPSARSKFGNVRRSDIRPPHAAFSRTVVALQEPALPQMQAAPPQIATARSVARNEAVPAHRAATASLARDLALRQSAVPGPAVVTRNRSEIE